MGTKEEDQTEQGGSTSTGNVLPGFGHLKFQELFGLGSPTLDVFFLPDSEGILLALFKEESQSLVSASCSLLCPCCSIEL